MVKKTQFIAVTGITVVETPCYRVIELKPGAEFRIIGKNGKFVCVGKLESITDPSINTSLFLSGKHMLKEWFASPSYQETYVKRAKAGCQNPHTTWNKLLDHYKSMKGMLCQDLDKLRL